MNDALTWAMAYILKDLLDEGAVDLSKLSETKRQSVGIMLQVIKEAISKADLEDLQ